MKREKLQSTSYFLHMSQELLFIGRLTKYFLYMRVTIYFLTRSYDKDKDTEDVMRMMLR